MTFRVSVYEFARRKRHRLVAKLPGMEERQAKGFMEANAVRHGGKVVAVIAEEKSVGEAA